MAGDVAKAGRAALVRSSPRTERRRAVVGGHDPRQLRVVPGQPRQGRGVVPASELTPRPDASQRLFAGEHRSARLGLRRRSGGARAVRSACWPRSATAPTPSRGVRVVLRRRSGPALRSRPGESPLHAGVAARRADSRLLRRRARRRVEGVDRGEDRRPARRRRGVPAAARAVAAGRVLVGAVDGPPVGRRAAGSARTPPGCRGARRSGAGDPVRTPHLRRRRGRAQRARCAAARRCSATRPTRRHAARVPCSTATPPSSTHFEHCEPGFTTEAAR